MTMPKKPSDTESGRPWPKWTAWAIAVIAMLLLVLEHRAHALGWWLHALLGLCVVLLYLLIRFGGDDARGNGPR
ncbi:MAG: DUF2933 domain-containing protein [Burkholderiaceae bacterium]|jgi:hypothetical protein|nr:DUF2933 domain-containing protein [Burkholderiaceae bacterium]